MKLAIWIVFTVIALCWTGLAALSAFIGEGLLGAVAAGSAASAGAAWTLPPWLALWFDPAALEALRAAWVDLVQWLGTVLPSAQGAAGWLSALIWIVWGFGVIGLLALAGLGHWLVGRFAPPASGRPA
jgi:hypothetical protein